jgi:hypothetical protein
MLKKVWLTAQQFFSDMTKRQNNKKKKKKAPCMETLPDEVMT